MMLLRTHASLSSLLPAQVSRYVVGMEALAPSRYQPTGTSAGS